MRHQTYDAMVAGVVDLPKHPVVSVAVGATAFAAGAAEAGYRAVERLPVVGFLLRRAVSELSARGERFIADSTIKARVTTVAVQVMDRILDEIDLNAVVHERLDIDALVADLDIDAVINRIDLIALADKVIEGVDLPGIIRESTNTVSAEVMANVRTQGERADDLVAGIVDRVLGRERD